MSPDRNRILLRSRDVIAALYCAEKHQNRLGKVQLQKFIYLCDAVSLLFQILAARDAYRTYRFGPWDASIQNAVDALVFRGFVEIFDLRPIDGSESLAVRYGLTPAGKTLGRSLSQGAMSAPRFRVALEVSKQVDRLGWSRLKELVYAEPAYVAAKSQGYGRELDPGEAYEESTRALVEIIRSALSVGDDREVPEGLILEAIFGFLDAYARPSAQEPESRWV